MTTALLARFQAAGLALRLDPDGKLYYLPTKTDHTTHSDHRQDHSYPTCDPVIVCENDTITAKPSNANASGHGVIGVIGTAETF